MWFFVSPIRYYRSTMWTTAHNLKMAARVMAFIAGAALFVEAQGMPVISSISPNAAIAGSAALALTVTGSNFNFMSIVHWNGLSLPTGFVSASTLSAVIPTPYLSGLDTATVTVMNGSAVGTSSNGVGFVVYSTLPLTTNDLIYGKSSGRIYASIPGSAPNGNSIVPIDPLTGAVGTSVFVGSEPERLAISDDGQYLYVALDGSASIRRVDLASDTAGLQFPVGSSSSIGPYFAVDIAVLPGHPSSVAVAGGGQLGGQTAVFDDGVRRPNVSTDVPPLAFSDSASVLYGFNPGDPSSILRTFSVDATGVTETQSVSVLTTGASASNRAITFRIAYSGGRIYAPSGLVLDPVAGTLVGTLAIGSTQAGSSVAADSNLGRVFILAWTGLDPSPAYILAFDSSTLSPVGVLTLSGVGGNQLGRFTSLVRWGNDGLAFGNDNNQVVLLRIPTEWLPSVPALSVSPTTLVFSPQPIGSNSSQTAAVTNNIGSPVSIPQISTTGDYAQSNNCGATLAAFATCTISVTFTPTATGARPGTLTIVDGTGQTHVAGLSGMTPPVTTPAITSISPAAVPVGSATFTLTVSGQNFVPGSVVTWHGTNLTTTFIISTSLTASIASNLLSILASPAITVVNPSGTTSNSASFVIYSALTLTTGDLIYDAPASKIYASIPSTAPSGDSVISIDPVAGTIGIPISVGFEPDRIAISDDGQYLYVSQKYDHLIRRLDLTGGTPAFQFALGSDQFMNPYGTRDMSVLPGSPSSLAVARDHLTETGTGGVGVYDNGILRPAQTGFLGSDTIVFSNSASAVYGLDLEYSDQPIFYAMSVNSNGVAVTNSMKYLINAYGGDIKYSQGRVYAPGGGVIDPVALMLLGTYPLSNLILQMNSVVPDVALNRVFFMTTGGVILIHNLSTFMTLGQLNLPANATSSLLRWGSDGLAFRSSSQVFLLRIPENLLAPQNRRRGQLTSQ
jgi:trimeric autotransporter adhesin